MFNQSVPKGHPPDELTGRLLKEVRKDLCQAQHHPEGHQRWVGLLGGREGALMGGSLVVWAGAFDQLAWTYFNIPALGEVTVIHSIVDVSGVRGEAKWSWSKTPQFLCISPMSQQPGKGPAQAHGLNTLNPGTPGETTMTWSRMCHTEEWGHCHFKRNVVSL